MGLLLDMEIRGRTRNRQSLDDVMASLYLEYAARDRGVPEDGLQRAIEAITNGTMQPFFDDHIFGTEPIDYDQYLYHAGYMLEIGAHPDKPSVQLGIDMAQNGDEIVIKSVRPESAAFEAGLDVDDKLLAIDGHRVTRDNLTRLLGSFAPGDTVRATFFRRDNLQTANIVLKDGGNTTYKLVRLPDTSLLQNQTRRDWMNLAAG
jgi:predicted metalloprotease with PDZ domain